MRFEAAQIKFNESEAAECFCRAPNCLTVGAKSTVWHVSNASASRFTIEQTGSGKCIDGHARLIPDANESRPVCFSNH
jgi:hypothetical protein